MKQHVIVTKEVKEVKQERLDRIRKLIAESADGITLKNISIETNIPIETARKYVKELVETDYIYRKRTDGPRGAYAYFWKEGGDEEDSDVAVSESGVEKDPDSQVKCGRFCKPGDVVYVSSRKGEGQFFRYLVITSWEKKATILCVFPESYKLINLNDPNYICIGADPETGKNLFADITNVCQRRYDQFGERLFHVNKEDMELVLKRLGRSMHIPMKVDVDETVVSLRTAATKLEAENDELKAKINEANHYREEELNDLFSQNTRLNAELDQLRDYNQELLDMINHRDGSSSEYDSDYVEKLESKYGESLITLSRVTALRDAYKEHYEFLQKLLLLPLKEDFNEGRKERTKADRRRFQKT